MRRFRVVLALVAVTGAAVIVGRASVPTESTAAQPLPVANPAAKADGAEEGIKKITAEYAAAFNAGDAKKAAALWTTDGEYVDADGEVQTGRAAIEKGLAELFKANQKLTAEVRVESVRPLGRGTATVEGSVRVKGPGDDAGTESRYTALHVLEDGQWHAASVREWVPDPTTAVTPQQLEWMIGTWSAKGENDVTITFAWDESKVFINGTYTTTKDGKTVSTGKQVIGKNPTGGLRSWTFDSSGTTSDGLWVRDGSRWVCEASGVLPDGTTITSLNVVVPLGPDAFTWQTTDRAADDVPLPALPPVKVTRVKK